MRALFACIAAGALLAGCGQPGTENEVTESATNNAPTPADAGTAGAAPLGAAVSGDEAKRIMDLRHEGMEEIGDSMKALTAALRSDSPDLAIVRTHAATLARLAPEVSGWYRPGTGPDVGKTRAKAEIWQKPDDFAAKARDFQASVQAFYAAAQGENVAAIKAAHANLGKTCKACHDPYRAPEGDHD